MEQTQIYPFLEQNIKDYAPIFNNLLITEPLELTDLQDRLQYFKNLIDLYPHKDLDISTFLNSVKLNETSNTNDTDFIKLVQRLKDKTITTTDFLEKLKTDYESKEWQSDFRLDLINLYLSFDKDLNKEKQVYVNKKSPNLCSYDEAYQNNKDFREASKSEKIKISGEALEITELKFIAKWEKGRITAKRETINHRTIRAYYEMLNRKKLENTNYEFNDIYTEINNSYCFTLDLIALEKIKLDVLENRAFENINDKLEFLDEEILFYTKRTYRNDDVFKEKVAAFKQYLIDNDKQEITITNDQSRLNSVSKKMEFLNQIGFFKLEYIDNQSDEQKSQILFDLLGGTARNLRKYLPYQIKKEVKNYKELQKEILDYISITKKRK